jgi:hypothetical protein
MKDSEVTDKTLPDPAGEVILKIEDLMEGMRAPLSGCFVDSPTGRKVRPGYGDEAEAAVLMLTLTKQYLLEMGRCHQSGAQFAATVMGCSALEAMLMLSCLGFKDSVVTSTTWHKHAKKTKTFVQNVSHADLDLLVGLGAELKWFPLGMSSKVIQSFPGVDMKKLDEALRSSGLGHQLTAVIARQLRNHLHPGLCLRENVQINEDTGRVGVLLALISILSYLTSAVKDSERDAGESSSVPGSDGRADRGPLPRSGSMGAGK